MRGLRFGGGRIFQRLEADSRRMFLFPCDLFFSLVTIGEGQLRNSRFIEFTQPHIDHFLKLFLCGCAQRKFLFGTLRQIQGDPRILGRVCCAEEARVIPLLHVLTIGLQYSGICASLAEHFAQHP